MDFITEDDVFDAMVKGILLHFHEWLTKYKVTTVMVGQGKTGYHYCGDKRRRNKIYTFDQMFKEYKKDTAKIKRYEKT